MKRNSVLIKTTLLLLAMCCSTVLYSQETVDNSTDSLNSNNIRSNGAPPESLYKQVMVSTPEMAALAKNVSCPVNYSTGTPQISIPLYTIECGSITLPLSLTYNASGVRVSEMSGMVGQGWSLSGIPSISRQIKGHEDKNYKCVFTSTQNKTYNYVERLLDNNLTNSNDELLDEYYYQLANKNGMFMYVLDSNIEGMEYSSFPYDDVKVKQDSTYSQRFFILTDDEGTVYRFNGGKDYTTIGNQPIDSGWKASSIVAANGVDSIHFEYGQGFMSTADLLNDGFAVVDNFRTTALHHWPRYVLYSNYFNIDFSNIDACEIEEVMTAPIVYKTTEDQRKSYQADNSGNLYSDNQPDVNSLGFFPTANSISSNPEIISFRGNTVTFGYTSSNFFHQLTSVEVKNSLNEVIRKIVLSYDNKSNTKRGFLKTVAFVNGNDTLEKYSFEYDRPEVLPKTDDRRIDFWGLYNNDSGNETTLVPKMTLNTIIDRDGANVEYYNGSVNIGASGWFSRAANENYMTCGTLKSITYPTGAKDEFTFEANRAKIVYNNTETDFHITQHLLPVQGMANTYQLGGLRIKQIKTTKCNGDSVNYRTFRYGDDGTGTTPIVDGCNYFLTEKTKFYYVSYEQHQLHPVVRSRYRTVSGCPAIPLNFYNGAIVMYDKVTEFNGRSESDNSGKTVYTFNVPSYKWFFNDMATLNANKYKDWEYGLMQSKTVYKRNGSGFKKLIKEEYNYATGCHVGNIVAGEYRLGTILGYPYDGTPYPSQYNSLEFEGQDTLYDVAVKLLTNVKTTVYDDAEHSMVTDEGLFHSIPYCTLVTRKETTLNENSPYIERYEYPYHSGNLSPYNSMVGQNAINYIVTKTSKRGNDSIIVNTPYTNSSRFKPESYRANYNNEGMANRISYLYDSHANRVQAIKDNKEKVTYLYGYNNQYVIAVIENAEYSAVNTALGNAATTIAAAAQPSTANWTSINGLRSSHPEWHITTYKWQPLVGVTSMTDPAGIETRYTYDGLGRLTRKSQIIDNSETIIEEYEYHYKTE